MFNVKQILNNTKYKICIIYMSYKIEKYEGKMKKKYKITNENTGKSFTFGHSDYKDYT